MKSIGRVGPLKDHMGNRAAGMARLKIRHTYPYRYKYKFYNNQKSIMASVYIYDIHLSQEINVTLPVIQDEIRLNKRDALWWDTYSLCIAEHENDHVRIIKQMFPVEDIKKEIQSVTSIYLDVS